MSEISNGNDDTPSERTAIKKSVLNTAPQLTSRWYYPRRYVVALMAFLGFCNVYAMRVNLSVAIVAMTTNKTVTNETGTYVLPAEYDWSTDVQGVILSSFFYGYILTQLPGGYLAAAYGGKRLFGVGIAVTSLFTLLTPLFTKYSLYLLVAARVVEGLFEGVTYPAMHAMWSRWAPPLERSKLAMISISGCYIGTVVALPTSGFLADYLGWPSIFYFSGAIAYGWSVLWFLYIKDKPQNDTRISEDELCYIRSTLRCQYPYMKVYSPIPWKRMLLSYPVWAIVIAHFSENWGFYTLLTELPTFMKDVFGYDLHKSGLLIALPYLAMGIFVVLGGYLADRLRSRGMLSTSRVRKLFNCTGFVLQTIFLLIAAHSTSPLTLVVCLTAAVGFGGFAWSGFGVNHLDIAPPYASILMGISNTFATLPGMFSPVVTGHLVQHKTQEEWQVVFYISSAIYLVGAIFYGIFASGEEQSWAHIESGFFGDDDSGKTDDLPFGEASCD
ncbi:sialin, putative [Pediculus humanus corporis]|uniref:Sialin n=1 Tax=Pediculus humanus subsp. corporis TaxID=121224 RepID=E0VT50_PEDHC|nr:sialin, putative [Pediculus humanus corporis]EEB16556.1 sialin, putative [Pediculus humanus corporis]